MKTPALSLPGIQVKPISKSPELPRTPSGTRVSTLPPRAGKRGSHLPGAFPSQQVSRRATGASPAYLSRAACGPVECTSRGCRPVASPMERIPDECPLCPENIPRPCFTDAFLDSLSAQLFSPVSYGKLMPSFPSEWEEEDAGEMLRAGSGAAGEECVRLVQLAEYSWRKMGDMARAEMLFDQALEEDPSNPSALASYALFLWEVEASHRWRVPS